MTGVAWSPDGRRIVSGSFDKTARIWDAGSGQEIRWIHGHTDVVGSVAYSPDGHRIVSGGGSGGYEPLDPTVRVWDAETGRELSCWNCYPYGAIFHVCYSPGGRSIASTSLVGGPMRIWDAEGDHRHLPGSHLGYSPDGRRIVTGHSYTDGLPAVLVRDAVSGQELFRLLDHPDDLPAAPSMWFGREDVIQILTYSPDGERITSGSVNGTVRVWDARTGQPLTRFQTPEPLGAAAVSPDGRHVACALRGRTLRILDLTSGREVRRLLGHEDEITGLAYSPDGRRIASAAADRTIRVWDTEGGQELRSLRCKRRTRSAAPAGRES